MFYLGEIYQKEGDSMSLGDIIDLITLILCIITFLDNRYNKKR